MTLNALNIDPGRVWKGIWRWYHEGMLDCCVPLDVVQEKGISLDTFACLARCNGAAATVSRAVPLDAPPDTYAAGLSAFRAALRAAVRNRAGAFLVASYSRKSLGQTGDGHFSPLAGYHEGTDQVLVLDVARFKYPPHWIQVETLYQAMQKADPDTGRPRGYTMVHRSAAVPLVLFAFGQGQTGGYGHTHSHGHTHGGGCCGSGKGSTAGGESGDIEGLVSSDGSFGTCSGGGRSITSAAEQLAQAARAIDGAHITLQYEAEQDEVARADAVVDAAIRQAVSVLLALGEGGQSGSMAQAAAGLPLHVQTSSRLPLLSLPSSSLPRGIGMVSAGSGGGGEGWSVDAEGGVCLTRLSREQVGAAAALLQDMEKLPLYTAVRRALEAEAVARQGTRPGVVPTGEGGDPTLLALHGHAPHAPPMGGALACSTHEALGCVRVHTAHVLTTLLLTMYAPGAGEALMHPQVQAQGAAQGARDIAGPVLRAAVTHSLASASPLVTSEVSLLRGQLLEPEALAVWQSHAMPRGGASPLSSTTSMA